MTNSLPICIVDDTTDFRLLLQGIFKQHLPDYTTLFFADGKSFLAELAGMNKRPSLIILNRLMPVPNGHTILLFLKQHPAYKTIPVVMLSAQASPAEIDACYQAGANSFVLKPLASGALVKLMRLLCEYWLSINSQQPETASY